MKRGHLMIFNQLFLIYHVKNSDNQIFFLIKHLPIFFKILPKVIAIKITNKNILAIHMVHFLSKIFSLTLKKASKI